MILLTLHGHTIKSGDRLLKASDVAKEYGYRLETVRRWASDADLPPMRTLQGHYRFWQSDVEVFLFGTDDIHNEGE